MHRSLSLLILALLVSADYAFGSGTTPEGLHKRAPPRISKQHASSSKSKLKEPFSRTSDQDEYHRTPSYPQSDNRLSSGDAFLQELLNVNVDHRNRPSSPLQYVNVDASSSPSSPSSPSSSYTWHAPFDLNELPPGSSSRFNDDEYPDVLLPYSSSHYPGTFSNLNMPATSSYHATTTEDFSGCCSSYDLHRQDTDAEPGPRPASSSSEKGEQGFYEGRRRTAVRKVRRNKGKAAMHQYEGAASPGAEAETSPFFQGQGQGEGLASGSGQPVDDDNDGDNPDMPTGFIRVNLRDMKNWKTDAKSREEYRRAGDLFEAHKDELDMERGSRCHFKLSTAARQKLGKEGKRLYQTLTTRYLQKCNAARRSSKHFGGGNKQGMTLSAEERARRRRESLTEFGRQCRKLRTKLQSIQDRQRLATVFDSVDLELILELAFSQDLLHLTEVILRHFLALASTIKEAWERDPVAWYSDRQLRPAIDDNVLNLVMQWLATYDAAASKGENEKSRRRRH